MRFQGCEQVLERFHKKEMDARIVERNSILPFRHFLKRTTLGCLTKKALGGGRGGWGGDNGGVVSQLPLAIYFIKKDTLNGVIYDVIELETNGFTSAENRKMFQ